MSDTVTRGIRVQVRAGFVPERSAPAESYFFFAYSVRISNEGPETAQLLSRRWVISGPDGDVGQVEGLGVVGQQPVLEPGQSFEYTSSCPLQTPLGSMHGWYRMRLASGETFEARIAPFSLATPTALN